MTGSRRIVAWPTRERGRETLLPRKVPGLEKQESIYGGPCAQEICEVSLIPALVDDDSGSRAGVTDALNIQGFRSYRRTSAQDLRIR